MTNFRLIYESDYAEVLAARVAPMPKRTVFVCNPLDSALVLGSSQSTEVLSADFSGERFRIVKRRSGGGAVAVSPLAQVWIDIFIPCDDPLYESDILKSPVWVGKLYAKTLNLLAVESCVYTGRLIGEDSRLICFAGLGPGEVVADDGKAVGISQRRNKDGTWFYTMLPLDASQEYLWDLFGKKKLNIDCGAMDKNILICESNKDPDRNSGGREKTPLTAKNKLKIEKIFLELLCAV